MRNEKYDEERQKRLDREKRNNCRYDDIHFNQLRRSEAKREIFTNKISSPSLEIGLITEREERWIPIPTHIDSRCPRVQQFSRDNLQRLSFDDMLKFPETSLLHHIIYSCGTCSFIYDTGNTRSPINTLNEEKKDLNSRNVCKLPFQNRQIPTETYGPKTQADNMAMCPMFCCNDNDESLLDIKLVSTLLTSKPQSFLNNIEESECKNIVYDRNSNVLESKEQKEEANKVTMKLGENLFLNLIADQDDRSNSITDSENKFPGIKIIVRCDGEIIKEISCPKLCGQEDLCDTLGNFKKPKEYSKIFCVNTPTVAMPALQECCNPECDEEEDAASNESESLMCCNADCITEPPEERKVSRSCSASKDEPNLCPNLTDTEKSHPEGNVKKKCNIEKPEPAEPQPCSCLKDQRKNSQEQERKSSKQEERRSSQQEKRRTSKTKRKSIGNCPTIPSLGSFSLFFIVNDMATENGCPCTKQEDSSNDLLSTAMICLHIDKQQPATKPPDAVSDKSPPLPTICSCASDDESSKSAHVSAEIPQEEVTSQPSQTTVTCSCSSGKQRQSIEGGNANPPVEVTPQSSQGTVTCSCPSVKQRQSIEGGNANPPVEVTPQPSQGTVTCSCPSVKQRQSIDARNGNPPDAGVDRSTMACPRKVSVSIKCPSSAVQSKPTGVQACPSQKSAFVQPSNIKSSSQQQISVQARTSCKSATAQPSYEVEATCPKVSCSRRTSPPPPSSNIQNGNGKFNLLCPPSCAINLPRCTPRKSSLPACTPRQPQRTVSTQPSTCSAKVGPSDADVEPETTGVKDAAVSCSTSKLRVSISEPEETASPCAPNSPTDSCVALTQKPPSCSFCVEPEKPASKSRLLRETCSHSEEYKREVKKSECFKEIAELNEIFDEYGIQDLGLKTDDYDDLKYAFERFMCKGGQKDRNPKCKFLKKG